MRAQSLGREDPQEEGLATHPGILAWEIPWTEEPGGLQSQGHRESDVIEVTEHACTDSLVPWPHLLLFAPMFNSVWKEVVLASLKREEEEAGRQTQRHTNTELEQGKMRKTGTNRREEEKGKRRHRERKEVCVYIERQRLGSTEEERCDD